MACEDCANYHPKTANKDLTKLALKISCLLNDYCVGHTCFPECPLIKSQDEDCIMTKIQELFEEVGVDYD